MPLHAYPFPQKLIDPPWYITAENTIFQQHMLVTIRYQYIQYLGEIYNIYVWMHRFDDLAFGIYTINIICMGITIEQVQF